MRVRNYIIAFIALSVFAASCNKESLKNEWSKQEKNIETFLANEMKSDSTFYKVGNKGSERLVRVAGQGDSLTSKGTISFYYAGYVLKGPGLSASNLFATNKESIATAAGWTLSGDNQFAIETLSLDESGLVQGLKNGLLGVKGGEECVILFSSRYGFGKSNLGTIPANSALAYHIWVESISNE